MTTRRSRNHRLWPICVRGRIRLVGRLLAGRGCSNLLHECVHRLGHLFANVGWKRRSNDDHTLGIGVDGHASGVVMPLVAFDIGLIAGEVVGHRGGQTVGRAIGSQFKEFLFVAGVGPTSQNPGLGIGQGVGPERLVDLGKVIQRVTYPDPLAGGRGMDIECSGNGRRRAGKALVEPFECGVVLGGQPHNSVLVGVELTTERSDLIDDR